MNSSIDMAINELIGQVEIGDVVANRNHELAHTLIDIAGNMAICELPTGERNIWPVADIFDVNRVKRRAIELSTQGNRNN